jgi:MFS superfamily sulfate permease-like transporter
VTGSSAAFDRRTEQETPRPEKAPRHLSSVRDEPVDLSFGATWRQDLRAGLVVFLVALPLCLGVALASGAPLMSGIITGIVGGLVVSRLSGSQLMVSGPAAGLTAIVATAIIELGSMPAFLLAVVLAGLLQLGLWRVGAGVIAYFFPSSVIKGMLAAIGLTLVLKQLPYAFGAVIHADGVESNPPGTLDFIASAATNMHPAAIIIALLGLAVLLAWEQPAFKRIKAVLPAPLAVVVIGLAVSIVLSLWATDFALPAGALVSLPTDGGLAGMLMLPDWNAITNPAVFKIAITLALIASLETLLSLEATDKLDPLKRLSSANRELMAQGVGNTLSGLIGGLPMTGVIVRSAANVDAGAKTWRSSFFHGLFLVVAVLVIAKLLNYIPLAALAAILIYTGFKLAHPASMRAALLRGPHFYIPFFATIIAILLTDLLKGIAVGLAFGMFFVLIESYANAYFAKREESEDHHRVKLYLAEEVSFLNKASIARALDELPEGCVATVDGNRSRYIDPDVIELLNDFRERATLRNITLKLVGIPQATAAPAAH